MLWALLFLVLLSPIWAFGLWWICEELFFFDKREGRDWQLVSLGLLLLLVGWGVPLIVWAEQNRYEAFFEQCRAQGTTEARCLKLWYGERRGR